MNYKNVKYGKNRIRRNYARVQTNVELPNLIEVQTKSFDWFIHDGLKKLLKEISPITNGGRYELYFGDFEFDEPENSIEESKRKKTNYSRSLRVDVSLKDNDTGEIKEESKLFFGSYPMMTPTGTFVINGAERVIVTQIIRSAGAFFNSTKDKKSGNNQFYGQIIPTRGAWIEFEIGSKDIWYAKLDRSKKIYLTTFLRALGIPSNGQMRRLFGASDYLEATKAKDNSTGCDDALQELYEKLRPGEKVTPDSARKYLASRLFDDRRYDLASVGRYKLNKKLDCLSRISGMLKDGMNPKFHDDITDPDDETKVVFAAGTPITDEIIIYLSEHRELIRKYYPFEGMMDGSDGVVLERVLIDRDLKDDYSRNNKESVVTIIGNDQSVELNYVTISDIFAGVSYYMNLHSGVGVVDDIDHLGNRRLRLIGELLENVFRTGLMKMEKNVKDRMSIASDPHNVTPKSLVNVNPLTSVIKDFMGSSQLSQFMDQINPLSELTHKRRLSALGAGGLTRDRAGFEVRDVHVSHYGRICPIETPEGQNIGLITTLATYARANEYGFIETPYLKVKHENGKAIVTDEIVYLTADKEEHHNIAQGNTIVDENHVITEEKVTIRYMGETAKCLPEEVEFIDVSPQQIVAVSTACIPFLEHDDANRALMGANMQRQAIPLLCPEAAFVATGIEAKAATDSGVAVVCEADGEVVYSDALKIVVNEDSGALKEYKLIKYCRSNNSTCVNQKPIVFKGERVKKGDVLADGAAMDQGEMALGRNVVIAFMTWNGYNYEDAVIMSERLVQDDVYTSIHIEEYEVFIRDTKNGKEEVTRELEDRKECIAKLDERGIVRVGVEVKEGDILVGKTTPKGYAEPTPEERISHVLFQDNSKDVKNTSKRVPHGSGGVVQRIECFSRKNGDYLDPGVNEVIRVYIVQKRKITEGDKMSGRHGNKGVISRILPQEDMPYMNDGTPVDIMLNPQGIPSRLNIGQVLEVHLGMAAKKLGIHIATPVFDGVRNEDLEEIMAEAGMDPDGKTVLYDGRTGKPFDNRICVGVMYMIKLAHMVDDKLHARSEGSYTLVTQQPMGGKAQNGGQRFGEMEVWALEAYGAAYTLREMLTIKSDDMIGRNKAYKAICDGETIPEPGIPEAFRALVKELQGLGLSVKLIDAETGEDVANKSIVEEITIAQKAIKKM